MEEAKTAGMLHQKTVAELRSIIRDEHRMDRHLTHLHLAVLWSLRMSCATVNAGSHMFAVRHRVQSEHVEARPV
jgi:hypothetical protein